MEGSLDWGLRAAESHSWKPWGHRAEAPGGRLIRCLLMRAAPEVSVAQVTKILNNVSALH